MNTDRRIGMFMYICLMNQAFNWMEVFKDSKEEFSKEIKYTYKKNKKLIELIESALPKDDLDRFHDDAEYFSRTLELIRKADSIKQKEELIDILRSYIDGDLKIIERGNDVDNKA